MWKKKKKWRELPVDKQMENMQHDIPQQQK